MNAPRVDAPLPPELAAATVLDHAGREATIGSLVAGHATLVSFLRHFGCTGCAEHVVDLAPRLLELHDLGFRTVFVSNGAPRYIEGFLERTGLSDKHAVVVTDPTLRAFDAAGLVRSAWATLGPRAIVDMARELGSGIKGHGTEGDPFQQGGAVVVDARGTVVFYHRSKSLGDHPRAADLVDVAMRTVAATSRVIY